MELAPLAERILMALEELLDATDHVSTDLLLRRLSLPAEARDELAKATSDLLRDGYLEGKQLRGDNKVLDVEVTRLSELGRDRLDQP